MRRLRSIALAYGVLLALLAFAAPAFFQPGNLRDLILSNVQVLIAAIGMTAIIITRQIDVSIGAQFAVCGIVAGQLAQSGLPMYGVAAGVLLAGALLGSLNGALVAWLRLPSIVVTLATMAILRNTIQWTTEGAWIRNLPASFQWFGLGQAGGEWAVVLTAAALLIAFGWGLHWLEAGRAIFATGSDAEAARLAGINTGLVTFSVFVLMGVLTGLAALLESTRFSEIQSNAGVGLELRVIAAVVVGGTSIKGGRGSLSGTLLGVAILATIGPALTFLGINAFWEKAIQGVIILWAVVMESVLARKPAPLGHAR